MLNIHLNILIEAIKVVYFTNSVTKFEQLININNANWHELKRLAEFHSIRPILAECLRKCNLNDVNVEHAEYYFDYSTQQSFFNLSCVQETNRLLELFYKNGISVFPFKGNVIINQYYQNKQLREVGDIDFIFQAESLKQALKLLLNDGYSFTEMFYDTKLNIDQLIDNLLTNKVLVEIPLQKNNIRIDFHWGLHYRYLPYTLDISEAFNTLTNVEFYNQPIKLPNTEQLFWIMILHHGGKEFWVKFKHLVDLMFFLKENQKQFDWDKMYCKAEKYKLQKTMILSFYLLESYFDFQIPEELKIYTKKYEKRNLNLIIKYWAFAQSWATPKARIKYERMLINNQDQGFSKMKYVKAFIINHSTPIPIGPKPIFVFSDKYPILNLITKVLSYLAQRKFF